MHVVQDGAANKVIVLLLALMVVIQSIIKLLNNGAKLHQLENCQHKMVIIQIQHLRALNQHQGELALK